MTISTTFRNQPITVEYPATAVSDNTKVVTPKTDKAQGPQTVDQFETAVSTGTAKGTLLPEPKAESGNKKLNEWHQLEQKAYENNLKNMAIGNQRRKNACGTTSLANALATFGLPLRHEDDFKLLDKAIRPWGGAGTPTGPGDFVHLAREYGMQAEQYSKCDVEDIARQLRAGHTVSVIVNWKDNTVNGGVHYVNIIGVDRDEKSGEITHVHVRNPWGKNGNEDIKIDKQKFMNMWSNVYAASKKQGNIQDVMLALPICDRTMIVIDNPDGQKLETPNLFNNIRSSNTNLVMNGINGLAAGANAVKTGAVLGGIGQVSGSVINSVVGGCNYIVGELIGKNMEIGGDKLMSIGTEMLQGNFWHKVGGGLAIFFGAIAKAIGWLLNVITNLGSALTDKITNLLSKSAEKHNARQALTEAINSDINKHEEHENYRERLLSFGIELTNTDENGEIRDAYYGLGRASLGTKVAMFELLAHEGKATAEEQAAALQLLKAAAEKGDLAELVEKLGGQEKVCQIFSDQDLLAKVNQLV